MNPLSRRPLLTVAGLTIALAAALSGCGGADTAEPGASSTADGAYPLTLVSPYGTTELNARPERVAVVSGVDLDIALALGITPVAAPQYGDYPLDPWTQDAIDAAGTDIDFYDSTDGTDFAAIAAAEPDVILATSGWTLDEDYEQLSKIAPIVSYQGDDGLTSMSWDERTLAAAAAVGETDKGQQVVEDVNTQFTDAAAAHPEFAGTTFTYAVIHPDEISYMSTPESDNDFFTDLGFTLPENASKFTESSSSVSKENIDLLDADVLLVGYPFGDEGLITRDALEADPLFRQIPAVAGGRYAVVGDDVASPLAYPTPLSQAWVLEQLLPVLASAVAGS